jgi:hypothetical protein
MYATRKSDLRSFTPNSKSVCRIENGSTNSYLRNDRLIEEFLKTIEPKYNTALAKLMEGKIDPESIYAIAGFAAYVIGCSPTGMRIFSEPLKAVAETMAVVADEHGALPTSPEALGGRSISEILQSGDIKIEVDPKYSQALGIQGIKENVAAFGNFKWDILFNRFDRSPFFTSDFPVAVELTNDWRVVNRIVPLAPNLAVRIRPDMAIDRKRADFSFANFGYLKRDISHSELVEINRLIVRCAEESVFYRDQSPWVENFITKNRHYRVEQITNKRRMGDGYLQVSTTRVVPYHHPPAC